MPRPGSRRGRSTPEPPATTTQELEAWFIGSLPDAWFTGPISVVFDRDEIIVSGALPEPEIENDNQKSVGEQARIEMFREETRPTRIAVAARAEAKYQRKVSWVATCGDSISSFTQANVPAMTRLSFAQRSTLDTLIEAGVARSRADALAWCVTLVGRNESAWIDELKEALESVAAVRDDGPHSER